MNGPAAQDTALQEKMNQTNLILFLEILIGENELRMRNKPVEIEYEREFRKIMVACVQTRDKGKQKL